MSPHLENCCLRLSANVAYQHAAKDIEYITGITVPAKTQLILVHYQKFEQPYATADITELSADGGKARLITPLGEKSEWKDYKAIVSEAGIVASFDRNDIIIDWANKQPLAIGDKLRLNCICQSVILLKKTVFLRSGKFTI